MFIISIFNNTCEYLNIPLVFTNWKKKDSSFSCIYDHLHLQFVNIFTTTSEKMIKYNKIIKTISEATFATDVAEMIL